MIKLKNKINNLKKDNFWRTLIKNSFWAFTGDASASVINLIVTIILIKLIGNDSFGVLVLAQSYMNILDVLINIQSWRSVIQFGQKSLVENDTKSLNSYVKLGCIMDIVTAIICTIVAIIISPLIGKIFGWNNELIICCQIFSITIISHFAGTPTAVLRLLDNFKLVSLDKFLASFFKLFGVLIFAFFVKQIDLLKTVWIFTISDFIGNIILVIFAYIKFNKKYSIREMVKSSLPSDKKQFINYTLWATISEIVDLPVNYIDVFVVSILGNAVVSIYKVFKQIVSILNKVTSPLQQSILPQFSELSALGKKKRGFDVVIKIRNTILRVTIPIALVIGSTSYYWLGIIYDNSYANYWYVLFIYLIIQTIALSFTTIHPFYLSLGNTKKEALITFIANVVYVILAYVFVNKFELVGMTFAFGVQVFIAIFMKYIDIKKVIKSEKI